MYETDISFVMREKRILAAKEKVVEAAIAWMELLRKHLGHEGPTFPHNKALWEAIRELEEVSRG
jgi:hypothetical protein